LDKRAHKDTEAMNSALKYEYQKMKDIGYKNIFYIEGENALGLDQEGTVDGVHFTDLGFMRYADFLLEKFEEFELIDFKNNPKP
jgi:lysophospholipase L1-like esterase